MTAAFDFILSTRVIFGAGSVERVGDIARELGWARALIVADPGIVRAGYAARVSGRLRASGLEVFPFHDFQENPDGAMAQAAADVAREAAVDSLVAVGGGSSLDCAKAANFLLTNGGRMRDYRGYGKATTPLLPMLAIPTTAGTGSEAQSYAVVSDESTHEKMACGDRTAAFRVAILDPVLTASQPPNVTAATGYDALSHAVESYVTTRRTPLSEMLSREAWRLLAANYDRVLETPADLEARGRMQLGAFFAGLAIEQSMLGATHACANPLTKHYGITHAHAIAMLLPHVVRWNDSVAGSRYDELLRDQDHLVGRPFTPRDVRDALSLQKGTVAADASQPGARLADLLARMAEAGGLPSRLSTVGVPAAILPVLAKEAAEQWTGSFNPRAFGESAALEIYRCAY
jgi:alcohol dehydrogenase